MKIKLLLLSFLFMTFYSCQKEEMVVIGDENQNITSKSLLKSLMKRVAQNPTSKDNLLDNSSCFSVQLPVTVIVNGQNITVSSSADYAIVQANLDAFSNDDDIVNFVFPITVTLQNFQKLILNSPDDLDDLMDDCGEDELDEIDCIAFKFPFRINLYNSNSQTPSTLTIDDNAELYNFLDDLSDSVYASIIYPIVLINSEGQNVRIANSKQLEDFIEDALDECDDDDPSTSNAAFVAIVSSGTWRVDYFFDEVDETAYFNGFSFEFASNGTSKAIRNSTIVNGEWKNFIDGSTLKFELDYQGDLLKKIEEDWRIIEFTNEVIRLKKSDDSNDNEYLYFKRN